MKRILIHAGCIAFALLFRWFTPHEALLLAGAACVFNLIFLPVLLPEIYREGEKNVTSGIFLYPVAVLLLVATLPLHVAGACWAMMALGDGAAALAGRGTPWPWNKGRTIVGSAAFLVAAFVGGAALWWWISFTTPPWTKLALAVALAGLVESLPLPVADDLTVPLLPAVILGTFAPAISISPYGAAFSAAFAIVAFALRLVTISGAIAGFVLATLLYSLGGWQAGLLLFVFFAIGSGATRFAYRKKQAMGLAERRRGARVAEQAVANAGAAVFFAFIGQPVGVAASLAAAAADTVATEIGPLLSKRFGGTVYLLANGRPARAGVSGGVSIAGTLAGIAAAALVTAIAIGTGGLRGGEYQAVIIGAASGSVIDSLLGGTLEKDGWLNNEGVNFLGTLAAGFIALGLFR